MATHSSTLAWKIPWMEEPGRLQSTGSQRVGHDWATSLSLSPKEGFRHIAKWFQFTFKKCNFERFIHLYIAYISYPSTSVEIYFHGDTYIWRKTMETSKGKRISSWNGIKCKGTNNTHTAPMLSISLTWENNLAKGSFLSVLTRIQILKDQIRSPQPCPKESKMVKILKHTLSNHRKNV